MAWINATKPYIAELCVTGGNQDTHLSVQTGAIVCCSLYGVRSRRSRVAETGQVRIVELISIRADLEHAAGRAETRRHKRRQNPSDRQTIHRPFLRRMSLVERLSMLHPQTSCTPLEPVSGTHVRLCNIS